MQNQQMPGTINEHASRLLRTAVNRHFTNGAQAEAFAVLFLRTTPQQDVDAEVMRAFLAVADLRGPRGQSDGQLWNVASPAPPAAARAAAQPRIVSRPMQRARPHVHPVAPRDTGRVVHDPVHVIDLPDAESDLEPGIQAPPPSLTAACQVAAAYGVRQILDDKMDNGVLFALIDWDPTWEQVDRVDPILMRQFHDRRRDDRRHRRQL